MKVINLELLKNTIKEWKLIKIKNMWITVSDIKSSWDLVEKLSPPYITPRIFYFSQPKVGIQNFGTEASCIFDRWDLVGTSKQGCHTQHKSDVWPDFKSAPKRSISHDSKFVFPDFWQMFLSPRLSDTFPKCRDAWLLMAFVCRNFGHMRIVNYVPSDSPSK